jgi:predicted transcriptional regulator
MKRKPYWEMTAEELADATRQFDEPFTIDQSRPLTAAERREWQQATRKKGRPRVGQGFKRISVSLEKGLLKRVTALAKKQHVSRSKLLAQVLEAALDRG